MFTLGNISELKHEGGVWKNTRANRSSKGSMLVITNTSVRKCSPVETCSRPAGRSRKPGRYLVLDDKACRRQRCVSQWLKHSADAQDGNRVKEKQNSPFPLNNSIGSGREFSHIPRIISKRITTSGERAGNSRAEKNRPGVCLSQIQFRLSKTVTGDKTWMKKPNTVALDTMCVKVYPDFLICRL